MERLTGLDAMFLHTETPAIHMHTLKVAIVDAQPGSGEDSFDRFREELARRLHLLPPFRRRMVDVPLGFHHPVWIEDPDFDLDFHLRRATVPAPGSQKEVDALVADIASHPLDHRHPLWEIWRLEGLADGGIAYVAKIHHAIADGIAAAHLLANVMTAERESCDPPLPARPWVAEPIPSATRLLLDASRDHVSQLMRLPALITRTFGGIWRLARDRRRHSVSTPLPFEGPRTALNRGLTAARSFATTSVDLDDIRRSKSALDVTMNDVVLAIVAGAMKRFLQAHGETLDRPLVAAIPVAAPGADEPSRMVGNRLSNLFTSLCTDIDEPVARARAIHAKMSAAKAAHEQFGGGVMQEWMEYVPPRPYAWLAGLHARLGLSATHRPPANVVVSNVRGPASALYIAGMKLRILYSVGPIVDGIGINITAWSYSGRLAFAVLAGREAVPDAHEVTACLQSSAAELTSAVARARTSPQEHRPVVAR